MGVLRLTAEPGAIAGSLDRRLGVIAVKLQCTAPDLGAALTWDLPPYGIDLPEWRPRTFALATGGQFYDVVCNPEGHLTPETAEGVEYSLEGTTANDAIETHPEYITLLDIYGGNKNEQDHTKIWPLNQPGGTDRNPMHGVTDYLVPGLIWTRKWVSQTLDVGLVRDLATISSNPPGNPPKLSAGRTWLLVRVRATFRGNIWQIEASWQISGPFGWVPEMYRYY